MKRLCKFFKQFFLRLFFYKTEQFGETIYIFFRPSTILRRIKIIYIFLHFVHTVQEFKFIKNV